MCLSGKQNSSVHENTTNFLHSTIENIQKFFGVNFKDFLAVNFKYSSENIESELMKTVTKNVIKLKITIRKVNFAKVVGKNDSMFGAMNPDL